MSRSTHHPEKHIAKPFPIQGSLAPLARLTPKPASYLANKQAVKTGIQKDTVAEKKGFNSGGKREYKENYKRHTHTHNTKYLIITLKFGEIRHYTFMHFAGE